MKISCLQEELKRGLAAVNRAVPSRTTLPMVKNVLLSAQESRLQLSATNLETSMTTWTSARVEREGSIAVPAQVLTDLVNSLPAGPAELEIDPGTTTVQIKCGHSKANINGADASEFPPIPTIAGNAAARIEAAALKRAITKVAFAAAVEESRPVLTGVEVRISEEEFRMAATDGFRLALYQDAMTEPAEPEIRVIVPARTLTEVARLLEDGDGPAEVTLDANGKKILFRTNGAQPVETVSQLLEGTFPNYEGLLPRTHETRTVFDLRSLQQAARITAIFAGNDVIYLDIAPEEDGEPVRAVISANSEETGNTRNRITPESVEGEAIGIAFHSGYLRSALSALGPGKAVLETSTPLSPGIFRTEDPQEDSAENSSGSPGKYLHLIMPMGINA
jgi:DNA polymerase-3 subunit beta